MGVSQESTVKQHDLMTSSIEITICQREISSNVQLSSHEVQFTTNNIQVRQKIFILLREGWPWGLVLETG